MIYFYDKEFKGIVCDASCVEECLQMIVNIGFDYDGFNSVEGLKSVIDELVQYAHKGLQFLNDGKIIEDEEAAIRSRNQAIIDRDNDSEI